jgi:uncharacterized protein
MKRILFGFFVAGGILLSGYLPAGADLFNEDLAVVQNMAEKGDPIAQVEMGDRFKLGRNGVKLDYVQALRWFHKAAELEYTKAYLSIAQMTLSGDGVEKNPAKAASWVRKAADKGDLLGLVALGRMYMDGIGVLQNDMEALKYFRKVSIYDLSKAEFFMGLMYEEGRGVAKDFVMAHAWYSLVSQGNPASSYRQNHREMLMEKLTPKQLREAEQISEAIKAKQKSLPNKYR